jgi:G:T/U-mismatch repair DNA glycosylase
VARPRRVVSAEERRALLLRRGELTALAQHPSWSVYEAVMREAMDDVRRVVGGAAMTQAGISLERQAYYRGVIRGMRTAMKTPVLAEDRLTEYLRQNDEEEEAASG